MRTTVNLHEDVAAAVDRLRRERDLSVSEAVDELIRAGLRACPGRREFQQRSHPLGLRIDVSNVAEPLELLDGLQAR